MKTYQPYPVKSAILLLAAALAIQIIWMFSTSEAISSYDYAVTAGFAALALTFGRVRWLNLPLRWFLSLAFLVSVADRLGWLGKPGASGVSWGNFSSFIDYTRDVNAFLPSSFGPTLAVLATIAETTLAVCLLLGYRVRIAEAGAAGLLTLFGIAMTISLGFESAMAYDVWVLAAGAVVLMVVEQGTLSLDHLLGRLRSRRHLPAAPGHLSIQ
jgi:uncharacterized membrane protein YphA (DoxX/SURF4 family)